MRYASSLARDELQGRGVFRGRKAKGARRQQLEEELLEWQQLLDGGLGTECNRLA